MTLLRSNGKDINAGAAAGTTRLVHDAIANALSAGVSFARNPMTNLDWLLELAAKVAWLAERGVARVPDAQM
jgi:hypothetical protein